MSSLIKAINRLLSKGIYILLFDVFNEWKPSLVKDSDEINRLLSTGMHVLLFDVFNDV